jgi:hypothetical protein
MYPIWFAVSSTRFYRPQFYLYLFLPSEGRFAGVVRLATGRVVRWGARRIAVEVRVVPLLVVQRCGGRVGAVWLPEDWKSSSAMRCSPAGSSVRHGELDLDEFDRGPPVCASWAGFGLGPWCSSGLEWAERERRSRAARRKCFAFS